MKELTFSAGAGTTYQSVLEQRTETIIEGNQPLGYRLQTRDHVKGNYDTVGELTDGLVDTQKIARYASFSTEQSFWGEVPIANVSGIERSHQKITTILNRTGGSWLVGFVESEESRDYSGDVSGTPDRVRSAVSSPYGDTNKLASLTRFPGHQDLELAIDYDYDQKGNVISEATSGANIESRSVTAAGFIDGRYPGTITNALGQSISVSYDGRFGFATRVIDANNRVTDAEYDPFGREAERVNADGVQFQTEYTQCLAGSCPVYGSMLAAYKVTTRSAISPTVDRYYDLLGRLIQQDTAAFDGVRVSRQEFNYDPLGRLYLEVAPFYPGEKKPLTSYEYDIRNRLTKVLRPDGSEARTDYIPVPASHQLQVAVTEDVLDSSGAMVDTQVRHEFYNLGGDLVKAVDAAGSINEVATIYAYDGSGLLQSVVINSDESTRSSFTYDDAGNRISMTGPNVGTVTNSYNALGQVIGQMDNMGQSTSYGYDKLGRLLQQIDEAGVAQWTYDPANGLGSLASRSYTESGITGFAESYGYTDTGKLNRVDTAIDVGAGARNYSHSYGYDGHGRLNKVVYPAANEVHYQYTGQGYLLQITDGVNPLKTFNDMNAFGHAVEEVYGNGVITTRQYDPNTGRLESINTGNGSVQDNHYRWRSDGILESRLAQAGGVQKEERFTYDSLRRLVEAETLVDGSSGQTLSTLYDTLGNILSKTSSQPGGTEVTGYQYGQNGNAGPHAISQVTIDGIANTLYYDANGAVTRYDAATGDDKWISWSPRQLPEEIVLGDAQGTATPTARDRFRYGPNGQRYYRESSWWDEQAQQLVTEKAFIIGKYEDVLPANDPDYQRIHKTRIDENILQVTTTDHLGISNTVLEYVHRDHLGSVEKVTDETGAVILATAFDPHGNRRNAHWTGELSESELEELLEGQGLTTRRGFTGHEHLDRTGLIHMNGRIFDPTLGRFISADPIVQAPTYSQSYNRYAYVFNSPLSFADPSGFAAGRTYEFNPDSPREPRPPCLQLSDCFTYYDLGGESYADAAWCGGYCAPGPIVIWWDVSDFFDLLSGIDWEGALSAGEGPRPGSGGAGGHGYGSVVSRSFYGTNGGIKSQVREILGIQPGSFPLDEWLSDFADSLVKDRPRAANYLNPLSECGNTNCLLHAANIDPGSPGTAAYNAHLDASLSSVAATSINLVGIGVLRSAPSVWSNMTPANKLIFMNITRRIMNMGVEETLGVDLPSGPGPHVVPRQINPPYTISAPR
ncbi:RHS repeat domain-containing protein [Gilvimarinus sp. F26214L]|uniref:RHS repeat domain-containing protein n=1 Tax=Gilvimarinus sp. DZF01 TaxID=3461371 RepID=UPI004046413F